MSSLPAAAASGLHKATCVFTPVPIESWPKDALVLASVEGTMLSSLFASAMHFSVKCTPGS